MGSEAQPTRIPIWSIRCVDTRPMDKSVNVGVNTSGADEREWVCECAASHTHASLLDAEKGVYPSIHLSINHLCVTCPNNQTFLFSPPTQKQSLHLALLTWPGHPHFDIKQNNSTLRPSRTRLYPWVEWWFLNLGTPWPSSLRCPVHRL